MPGEPGRREATSSAAGMRREETVHSFSKALALGGGSQASILGLADSCSCGYATLRPFSELKTKA